MYSNQTSVITKNVRPTSPSLASSFSFPSSYSNSPRTMDDSIDLSINGPTPFVVQRKDDLDHDDASRSSCSPASSATSNESYLTSQYFVQCSPPSMFTNPKAFDEIHSIYDGDKELTTTANAVTAGRKRPISMPFDYKDESYWERRRRNNESAKRSRETRRKKEMETTHRILFLEQENIKLKTEVNFLREELQRLRENELFQYLMKKTIS